MTEFNVTRIDRLRYRPTKAADEFIAALRAGLMPGDKAPVIRLAIARSLAAGTIPPPVADGVEYGSAVEGVHLFGGDGDLWACLIAQHRKVPIEGAAAFRALVEAHIQRGVELLRDDYREAREQDVEFIIKLASLLPRGSTTDGTSGGYMGARESVGEVLVPFGSVSLDEASGERVAVSVNAPGTSPHIALMGKTRSGKTRTGLEIASAVATKANLPVLFIDPKGEFVKNGKLVQKAEWQGGTLERFFPGIRPIDVPINSIPLDFLWRPSGISPQDQAQLAIAFKDSFQKCVKARGDVAMETLREVTLDLIRTKRDPISLETVAKAYREAAEAAGRSAGSIAAKLSEITSLNMIEPKNSPADFFSRRWVISFGGASAEPRKLAIFLVLDALSSYLMGQPDATVDGDEFRALRHLLVVDEAREILSYRHGALSTLVRKSASKGGVTMLLSQGPDDFDQEEDDFLEQMGTVGVFALSSSSVKSLAGTFGRRRVEEFSDRSLPRGVAYVKLSGQTPRKVRAWQ